MIIREIIRLILYKCTKLILFCFDKNTNSSFKMSAVIYECLKYSITSEIE